MTSGRIGDKLAILNVPLHADLRIRMDDGIVNLKDKVDGVWGATFGLVSVSTLLGSRYSL